MKQRTQNSNPADKKSAHPSTQRNLKASNTLPARPKTNHQNQNARLVKTKTISPSQTFHLPSNCLEDSVFRLSKEDNPLQKSAGFNRIDVSVVSLMDNSTAAATEDKKYEETKQSKTSYESHLLDRHTFYLDNFSLFKNYDRSGQDLTGEKTSQTFQPNYEDFHGFFRSETIKEEQPAKSTRPSKSSLLKNKIAEIAIPKTGIHAKPAKETRNDKIYKSASPDMGWMTSSFTPKADKMDFTSLSPKTPVAKIELMSCKSPVSPGKDYSPSYKGSPKYNGNPFLEPSSHEYRKFNKLFKTVDNRTMKKLDPERFKKVVRPSIDQNYNFKGFGDIGTDDESVKYFIPKVQADPFRRKESSVGNSGHGKNY